MNKKLEQGAESFKQFIVDEYNQLFEQLQKTEEELKIVEEKYRKNVDNYFTLSQELYRLKSMPDKSEKLLKFADERNLANQNDNYAKINFLEKRLEAMTASYGIIVRERNEQEKAISKLTEELKQFSEVKVKMGTIADLTKENTKLTEINSQLIQVIDELGYKVVIEKVTNKSTKDCTGNKYLSCNPTNPNIKTLQDILKGELSKKYHVKDVSARDVSNFTKSDSDKFWKDFLNNTPATCKRDSKRDSKGRFSK